MTSLLKIIIKNYKKKMFIGIYEHEENKKQKIFIDLIIKCNVNYNKDNKYIDYDIITSKLDLILENKFKLLEDLQKSIIESLIEINEIEKIKIIIKKPKATKKGKYIAISSKWKR